MDMSDKLHKFQMAGKGLLLNVAVNHENDTCLETDLTLVMVSADCLYYAGLVKTPKMLFKRKLGPLPDTLQAGACVPPVPTFGSIWVVLWLFVSGPLPLRSHKRQVTFSGPFLGVPSHLDYTLSIEAQCDHHTLPIFYVRRIPTRGFLACQRK